MLRIWEPLVQIRQGTFNHSDQTGWDVAVDVMLDQEPPKQLNRLLGDRLHFLYGASTCNVPDRAPRKKLATPHQKLATLLLKPHDTATTADNVQLAEFFCQFRIIADRIADLLR